MKALFNSIRNLGTVGITLLVSVALHAAILLVHIANPEAIENWLQDTPMEVVLVNAQSKEAPDKAQALAQHNLNGGGESDKPDMMAQSPAPPSALTELGQEIEQQEQESQQLQQEQVQVLAQAKETLATLPQYTPQEIKNNRQAADAEKKRRALLQQLGAIEKRINEENSRPKKGFVSPATKASSKAHYYQAFRDKVEKLGTDNFPTLAGKRLYGELTLLIYIDAKGQVLKTEIPDGGSSGSAALDRIAQSIVRAGAPYGDFTPEMLKDYQILVIASRFKFTRDAGMQTSDTKDIPQSMPTTPPPAQ